MKNLNTNVITFNINLITYTNNTQQLTGNIGYHHIHHLSSGIPNYNLSKCAKENPILQELVTVLKFKESLKLMFHKLWDEESQRMISFREYNKMELIRVKAQVNYQLSIKNYELRMAKVIRNS